MKFCISPILNVVISNLTLVFENFEPEFPNIGIMGKKCQLSNLNNIFTVHYFEGADFKPDICFLWFLEV